MLNLYFQSEKYSTKVLAWKWIKSCMPFFAVRNDNRQTMNASKTAPQYMLFELWAHRHVFYKHIQLMTWRMSFCVCAADDALSISKSDVEWWIKEGKMWISWHITTLLYLSISSTSHACRLGDSTQKKEEKSIKLKREGKHSAINLHMSCEERKKASLRRCGMNFRLLGNCSLFQIKIALNNHFNLFSNQINLSLGVFEGNHLQGRSIEESIGINIYGREFSLLSCSKEESVYKMNAADFVVLELFYRQ